MSRKENRKKRDRRERLISIGVLSLIIFGVIFSNSVFANGNDTDIRLGNESKTIHVSWSRTPEPTNDKDFINIMNDNLGGTTVEVDEYSQTRTGIERLETIDNLTNGKHSITFKVSGKKNQIASKSDGHISYVRIYQNMGDLSEYVEVKASEVSNNTSDENKFIFSSGWTQESNGAYAGAGNSFTINFTGEKVELYGIKDPNHGIMEVIIDGQSYYSNEVIDGNNYIVVDNYIGKSEGLESQIGKVLTTPVAVYTGNNNASKVLLDYNTITNILKPTEISKVWDSNPENGSLYYDGYIKNEALANYPVKEFATWKHYGGDSWRLFRGEFDLSGYDLTNKRIYLGVLGENGPELIMPLNDFMIVLVDGQPTDINFTTQDVNDDNKNNIKLRLEDESIYTPTFKQAYHKSAGSVQCTDRNHTSISQHTDSWHAHLNNEAESTDNGYRLGDITPFLTDGSNHKIEILCADNTGGGGGTKLDVFLVDAPSMKVEKGGFVIDDTKGDAEKKVEINSESNLYPGESVYYTFSMTNDGVDRLNSLEFNDELINVKINRDGVYNLKTGDKLSSESLKITKISKAEDGTETKRVTETKDNALELLKELYPNESIIVEDLNNIKYDVTQADLKRPNGEIVNTVIGTAKYLNNQLTAESEASFKVTVAELAEPKVTITKDVFEVKRNGNTIYSSSNNIEGSSVVPGLYPGDEVSFYFTITNNTKDENRPYNKDLPVTNLSLVDNLSSPYENPEWEFTIVDKNFDEVKDINFDASNFDLASKESINVVASKWIVPEPFSKSDDNSINIWDYDVINTVSLYKENSNGKKENIGNSSVNVKILPPKLYLNKVVTNPEDDKKSLERIFTIDIKGNDGSSFTIEAKANKVYIIDNLKYGVTYTVSEIIPANYELESITLQEENGDLISSGNTVQLTMKNMDKYVVVSNRIVNKNYFYDDTNVTNVFKYPLNKN